MGTVPTSFYVAVLQDIGAPVSVQNLQACNAWEVAEGGTAKFNPWNTTQPMPGATPYNTFGNNEHVWNYPSATVGIQATVDTLRNGYYPHILNEFKVGNNGLGVCEAVDASPWGTMHAAAVYTRLYPAPPAPPPRTLYPTTPYMHGADVKVVQEHLQAKGFNVGPSGADGIYGPNTVAAVRRFQSANHLTVDGIVGPITRHALGVV